MNRRKLADYAKWYYILPMMFVVGVLPLIVYLKVIPLTGQSYASWTGVRENYDFFSYYKGIWLIIAASVGTFLLVTKIALSDPYLFKKELKPIYIAVGIYLSLIIGSTLFSDYRSVALSGFPDRYEGVYVLVAYLVIFFTTTALVQNEQHVKLLLGALIIGALLIGLIGLLQYIGLDPLKTDLVKSVILPKKYMSIANDLEFQFDKYVIYATLFHYNYVGSYTAMLLPLCFTLFVFVKRKSCKIFMGLMTLLMGIVWLGCNARSGIVGVALALIVFLIAINNFIKQYWKYFVASLVLIAVIFVGLNQLSGGFVSNRISTLITDVKVVLGLEEKTASGSDSIPLKDIKVNGNQATVITDTEVLKFTYENHSLLFADENGILLDTEYDIHTGKVVISDPVYKDYKLLFGQMEDNVVLQLIKGDINLLFDLKQDKVTLIDNKGNEVSLDPVESWGFKGLERLGSSRGYIWSRSLPLLKNTLVFGYGPDTFAIAFPQHDIYGKMYAYYGDMWHIVDKPHNLYLQIAINTGVISLLAFLFLVGYYIYTSFRLYVSNPFNEFLSQVGLAVFIAIVGYLGAAFFNDSVVSVAPVFWVLLGLGVSINYMNSK